jgi:hypothetical protein
MKTVSNTAPRNVITCVQINGMLVQQYYVQTDYPILSCFLHTEIPVTQSSCHIMLPVYVPVTAVGGMTEQTAKHVSANGCHFHGVVGALEATPVVEQDSA